VAGGLDNSETRPNAELVRGVNRRIEELSLAFDGVTPMGQWGCECADVACIVPLELTLSEYRQVRAHPRRFIVAPSDEHVASGTDVVVFRTVRYWVVEKLAQPSGEPA
jgi:hypothetical protein